MLEAMAIFAGSFAVALSGALMPGPLFTVTISESVRHGSKAGPLLMTGHAILELLLVASIILGLGAYLKLPNVMGILALLGGSLLVYLGIDMVRTAGRLSLRTDARGADVPDKSHPVLLGALASLSNPYWVLWWATIGLGYLMTAMRHGFWGIAAFFLGHITADFAWYSLISIGICRGRSFLKDSGYRFLIRACGVFLFTFGGWFLFSAKGFLFKSAL